MVTGSLGRLDDATAEPDVRNPVFVEVHDEGHVGQRMAEAAVFHHHVAEVQELIAKKHGVKPENVLVGSGSTQLLRTTTHVFCSRTAGRVSMSGALETMFTGTTEPTFRSRAPHEIMNAAATAACRAAEPIAAGEISKRRAAAVVTGALSVAAGGTSPELTVSFIDHDGDDIALEAGEYWVEVGSDQSATATWQGTAADGFTGRVTGVAAGATTLSIQLHHGTIGAGHPDGDPYTVPVTVTAALP